MKKLTNRRVAIFAVLLAGCIAVASPPAQGSDATEGQTKDHDELVDRIERLEKEVEQLKLLIREQSDLVCQQRDALKAAQHYRQPDLRSGSY